MRQTSLKSITRVTPPNVNSEQLCKSLNQNSDNVDFVEIGLLNISLGMLCAKPELCDLGAFWRNDPVIICITQAMVLKKTIHDIIQNRLSKYFYQIFYLNIQIFLPREKCKKNYYENFY